VDKSVFKPYDNLVQFLVFIQAIFMNKDSSMLYTLLYGVHCLKGYKQFALSYDFHMANQKN